MLSDRELEKLFIEWKTPEAGRKLIRKIREDGPVRDLAYRMDCVRSRFISKKMQRAVFAESRTCELPAIYQREYDPETMEYWPQPVTVDLFVETPSGGSTRFQHTPDLFVIEHGFIMEEWRELERLEKLARDRPHQFYRDEAGYWHYVAAEKHFEALGIKYRLRCSDEHPRVFQSNLSFLEEYSFESTPPVPSDERERLVHLLAEHKRIGHLSLVIDHGFKADHIFQLVLEGSAYVDLHAKHLRKTDELVIYQSKTIARADEYLRLQSAAPLPNSAFKVAVGAKFLYDSRLYEVVLLGTSRVAVRDCETQKETNLELGFVETMFAEQALATGGEQTLKTTIDTDSLFKQRRLMEALDRLEAVQNGYSGVVPERTLRRWAKKVKGVTSHQDRLEALMSRFEGNSMRRLPTLVLELADKAIRDFHNQAAKPKVQATYSTYITMCEDKGVTPMGRTNFYEYVKQHEDVQKREGKRIAYQKAPVPLSYDYEHPVLGVLPHEVCYCDHTIFPIFLKGTVIEDLGKPTITLMVDGALSMARAFYLSYQPASTVSVLMCLRDYVRRNRRLPRILVLDNGKEFHSKALAEFCSLFGIAIRWRRRSRPRDSAIVERMLGATEQEVISALKGNSLALHDPRMVSSTHLPQRHITWTLPALHGAIQHYLFEVHAKRIHPRFGISPVDKEKQMLLEYGAREHVVVRLDQTFKLLTSPEPRTASRKVDRQRGVFVDGLFYWHNKLALAKKGEECEVRVELWCASIVYVQFRGEWYMAQARDGGALEGRYRQEYELQMREETRAAKNAAQKDKNSAKTARKRVDLWNKDIWDPRAREQLAETYFLYERLGMAEAMPEAKNPHGATATLSLTQRSQLMPDHVLDAEDVDYLDTADIKTRVEMTTSRLEGCQESATTPSKRSAVVAAPVRAGSNASDARPQEHLPVAVGQEEEDDDDYF